MSDLFEDKSAMPDNANVTVARPREDYVGPALPGNDPMPRTGGAPVRVSQTLRERYDDRADDALSVRNVMRPRRGHAY